jgi:hypothetical protein
LPHPGKDAAMNNPPHPKAVSIKVYDYYGR